MALRLLPNHAFRLELRRALESARTNRWAEDAFMGVAMGRTLPRARIDALAHAADCKSARLRALSDALVARDAWRFESRRHVGAH